jgi:hypothetical protein
MILSNTFTMRTIPHQTDNKGNSGVYGDIRKEGLYHKLNAFPGKTTECDSVNQVHRSQLKLGLSS